MANILKHLFRVFISNPLYKKRLWSDYRSRLGKHCIIGKGVSIGNRVKIGNNVSLRKISIADDSIVESYVKCVGTEKGSISVGSNTYIGISNYLDTSADIRIGSFVQIAGPSTALWTHSGARMCLNNIPLSDMSEKHRPTAPIVIDDNVYIGGNCTIYPGVRIGHHSVVAPNSAVSKDVPPYSMVGGVPARFIKSTERLIEGSSGQTQQGQEGNSNE